MHSYITTKVLGPGSVHLYRPWKTLVFELTWQLLTKARSLWKVLTSIIKCLEMCGRQGIALGGHRDDSTSDDISKGKFRALVDFRIVTSETLFILLKELLEKQCAKCYLATYPRHLRMKFLSLSAVANILTNDVKAILWFCSRWGGRLGAARAGPSLCKG